MTTSELVEKLAREAGFDVSRGGSVYEPTGCVSLNSSLERFAQLVAQEAVNLIVAELSGFASYEDADAALNRAEASIRARFGIKEG